MKKLMLCAVSMLCIAASIFGGYYYYVTNDLQETRVDHDRLLEENKGNRATDQDIPMLYRGGAWKEEDGHIKENGIADALSQRKNYLTAHMPPDGFGDKGDGSGIPGVPTNWLPRGPQNLGGRTEAIVLHPAFGSPNFDRESNSMWAGGSTGGVWKSFSGGNSWFSTNTDLQNYNVSCIELDPENPRILYAGTGQSDGASLLGGGVFKSIDGGMTWARFDNNQSYNFLWSAVNSISVAHVPDGSPDGETIILAAVENYRPGADRERGIMRYTEHDHTWRKATDINNPIIGSFVGFDPNNSARAVASTCRLADANHPKGYCKAWYSTDYGQSWLPSQLDRCDGNGLVPFESPRWRYYDSTVPTTYNDTIHFAFQKAEPGSPTTLYAQYGDQVYRNEQNPRTVMSKSDYTGGAGFGAKFSSCNLEGIPDGITQGVHAFWVSPPLDLPGPQSNAVITGGAYLYRSLIDARGFEEQPIGNGFPLDNPANPHADMQTVVTEPHDPTNKKVFVATDGGVYHTDDITTVKGRIDGSQTPFGWTTRNNKLQNTQYFSVSGDASSGATIIYGGTQDDGSLRLVGTSTDAAFLDGGDGAASAVDGSFCFGQYDGVLHRFADCGSSAPVLSTIASAATIQTTLVVLGSRP